jgi:hypothetical protein
MKLGCKEVLSKLVDYVENDLEPAMKSAVEEHLLNCPHCGKLRQSYEKTIKLVRKSQAVEPDSEMQKRVWNYVNSHLSKPTH